MASKQPTLKVHIAKNAIDELKGIWLWNARQYHPAHADEYGAFLKRAIDALATDYPTGKFVEIRPDLRFIQLRQKSRGHSQLAVYAAALFITLRG